MSSTFHINHTSDNIRKSFVDYERETLPQYTVEQINEEIQKGEKSFFTKTKLEEFKSEFMKGEVSEEIAKSITEDIKKLQPVVINKSDNSYEIGYFLPKEKQEDSE